MKQNYKIVGRWWNNHCIELIEKDGEFYRLTGWNGYEYAGCWKCLNEFDEAPDKRKYCLRPVYSEKENENGAFDIIDYQIL